MGKSIENLEPKMVKNAGNHVSLTRHSTSKKLWMWASKVGIEARKNQWGTMFKNGGIEEHKEIYRKHSANIHNYVYIYIYIYMLKKKCCWTLGTHMIGPTFAGSGKITGTIFAAKGMGRSKWTVHHSSGTWSQLWKTVHRWFIDDL